MGVGSGSRSRGLFGNFLERLRERKRERESKREREREREIEGKREKYIFHISEF